MRSRRDRGLRRRHRRLRRRERLAGDHRRQSEEPRLGDPEERGVALGHRPLVDRVRLGRLPLRLLEGEDPLRGRSGQGAGGRDGGQSGRGRDGLDLHRLLQERLDGRGRRREGDRPRQRRGARGIRGRERGRASRRGVDLSVVGAADRDGELRRGRARVLLRPAAVREELRGRHPDARGGEPRERELERLDAVPSLPVEAHGEMGTPFEDAAHEAGENRAGADFDESARAGRVHRLDHLDEPDLARDLARQRGAQLRGLAPVRRGEDVRVDRERGRGERDVLEEAGEGLAGSRDQLGVEGGGHGETLEGDPFSPQLRLELLDVRRRARDDDLRRAVVVRDDDPRREAREELAHLPDRKAQRRHRPRGSGRLGHPLAAAPRDSQQVFVAREDARRAKGDDLAEAVPADEAGPEPDLAEERELRERDAGDRRLRPLRRREAREVALLLLRAEARPWEDDLVEGRPRLEVEVRGAVPRGERRRERHREVRAHAEVLASLPREEKSDRALVRAGAVRRAVGERERLRRSGVDPLRRLGEARREAPGVRRDDGEARGRLLVVPLEARARDPREPPRGLPRGGLLRERARLRRDLRAARSADDDELAGGRVEALRARRGARVLLERDVEVGAAEAERAHRGPARVLPVADPRPRLRAQVEGALFEAELRVRRVDLDRRREHAVVEGEDRLEEPGRAGRRLRVADLALHRAERAPLPIRSPRRVEDEAEPLELGDVARLRPGPVRLDELDRLRPVARELVGAGERLRLPRGHRGVDALAAAVRGGADAADDRVDPVAVPLGVGEALQGHHPEPLAEHRAVGPVAEGAAVAARRERRRLREAEEHEDVVQRVDSARDDEVAVAELQLRDRHRERAQRRGARRVGDAVRAPEVQAVRDAPRDDVPEEAGERRLLPRDVVARDPVADRGHLVLRQPRLAERLHPDRPLQPADHRGEELLGARHAEDHRGPRAVRRLELLAEGVLEDLLRHDQREELRGVRRGDRRGGNAPAERVEVDRVEKGAPLRVGLVGRRGIRVVIVLDEPVARRHVADQVRAGEDVLPEARGVGGAGEEGAHADDGDGRAVRGRIVRHADLGSGFGAAGSGVSRGVGGGSRTRRAGRRGPRRGAAARGSPRRRLPSGSGRPGRPTAPRASRGSFRGPRS